MRTLICLLLLTAVLSSCASTSVDLNFIAIKPVNETKTDGGTDGVSRVVDVRIYQLRTNTKFDSSSVENIWANAEEELGEALIEVKLGESIFPEDPKDPRVGKVITIDPIDPNTRFIGVLALFSHGENDRKVSVPIDQAESKVFELTGYRINLKQR